MSAPIPAELSDPTNPVVLVAHPGHEIRLYGWIARTKPAVNVLTKGSRHTRRMERLDACAAILDRLGARRGALFGEVFDTALYESILMQRTERFHAWTDALRDSLVDAGTTLVICDGWQSFSVAHDLASLIARVAAAEAADKAGHDVAVLEFAPVPESLPGVIDLGPAAYEFELTDALKLEKSAVAKSIPDLHELNEYIGTSAEADLLRERFYRPCPLSVLLDPPVTPLYERYGRERVSAGLYDRVIGWESMRPIVESLLARCQGPDRGQTSP